MRLMDVDKEIESLRPYKNSEVADAINRLISHPGFERICKYLYPGHSTKKLIELLRSINTLDGFQSKFSHDAIKTVLKRTSDGLTYTGINKLTKNQGYLFIANHRDIILDSAFMELALVENRFPTTQIAFGSNLMANQLITDLARLNKVFIINRGGSKKEIFENTLLRSKYIHKVVIENNESLWISQRNGRTKNGDDKTQRGLLKMLVGPQNNIIQTLMRLNVIPVTISYEYEPCDIEKAIELYISKKAKYRKSKNEDINSMLSGIVNHKGRMHLTFGKPLNDALEKMKDDKLLPNDIFNNAVNTIDNQMYKNYKLWKTNYIAWDKLNNSKRFNNKYTEEEKEKFINYLNNKINKTDFTSEKNEIERLMMEIYSNPVNNLDKLANVFS